MGGRRAMPDLTNETGWEKRRTDGYGHTLWKGKWDWTRDGNEDGGARVTARPLYTCGAAAVVNRQPFLHSSLSSASSASPASTWLHPSPTPRTFAWWVKVRVGRAAGGLAGRAKLWASIAGADAGAGAGAGAGADASAGAVAVTGAGIWLSSRSVVVVILKFLPRAFLPRTLSRARVSHSLSLALCASKGRRRSLRCCLSGCSGVVAAAAMHRTVPYRGRASELS
jgi:hypothetical protein